MNAESHFWRLVPEIEVGLSALLLFLFDVVWNKKPSRLPWLAGVALFSLVFAFLLTLNSRHGETHQSLFFGQLVSDSWSQAFRLFAWAVTGCGILMAALSSSISQQRRGEYFALLLSLSIGLSLMVQAGDGLLLFVSVEWVSLLSYCLVALGKDRARSIEASLKYALYGAVASASMLFGLSYLYGLGGHLSLWVPYSTVAVSAFPALSLGWAFLAVGIAFKVAAVPWHMWCPDVYEGAPTPLTAFLSVAPKAAGLAVFFRIADVLNGVPQLPVGTALGVCAALTMTWGNLMAFHQERIKRMLAYSAVAQAGYLLLGVTAGNRQGATAVLLYLVVYLFMDLGAFWAVSLLEDAGTARTQTMQDYRGLGTKLPWIAIALTLCLASLAGLPPLGGFVGKFHLFQALIERGEAGSNVLALVAVLNSALSFFYYGPGHSTDVFRPARCKCLRHCAHSGGFAIVSLGMRVGDGGVGSRCGTVETVGDGSFKFDNRSAVGRGC